MDVDRTKGRVYLSRSHEYSRQPETTRVNATYRGLVTLPHTSRVQFAKYMQRTLASARAQGMTDRDIHKATGISPSTFHHWQNGESVPKFATLQRFCKGLDVDVEEALATLRSDVRKAPEPEPPMDPDVLKLLRKIADPTTSPETVAFIKAQMRFLANMPEPTTRRVRRRRAS